MVHSVEKAFALLNAVAAHKDWIGVRELSRITGMKPPTAQQLLKTLLKTGYLEFDEEACKYRVGMAALLLGDSADASSRFGEFVKPYVDAIFEEHGETTAALGLERGAFISLYWRQSEKELVAAPPSTRIIPDPHGMASGMALLAWQGESFISNYIAERKLHPKELLESLKRTRGQGYAELVDFGKSGVAAYGVPVFDLSGKAVLSIGWSIPLVRFTPSLRKTVLERLSNVSAQMSGELKFQKGSTI